MSWNGEAPKSLGCSSYHKLGRLPSFVAVIISGLDVRADVFAVSLIMLMGFLWGLGHGF
jgi:hypothetical protein